MNISKRGLTNFGLVAVSVLFMCAHTAHAAQLSLEKLSFSSNEPKLEIGSVCTSALSSAGEVSYIDSHLADTIHISGQTDATVLFVVAPSVTSILCWGAARTMQDSWAWQAEYQLNGDVGAKASVSGEMLIQWYRWLLNEGPGESRAYLDGLISIYVRRPGGLFLASEITVDESIRRSSLGFSGYLDDWRTKDFHVGELTVGESLVIVASFGAGASADLTDYLPGGFSAVSNTFFSLTATISEIPAPQPGPAAAIPTLSEYALMLLAMLVAVIGIARGKAHF